MLRRQKFGYGSTCELVGIVDVDLSAVDLCGESIRGSITGTGVVGALD